MMISSPAALVAACLDSDERLAAWVSSALGPLAEATVKRPALHFEVRIKDGIVSVKRDPPPVRGG